MNKPIKAALCVILSALFLLSGCNSGKKEKSESSDSKSTSDSASVKPKATEPVAATAATAPAAAVASSHQGKIKARLLVPEMPSQTLPDTGSV